MSFSFTEEKERLKIHLVGFHEFLNYRKTDHPGEPIGVSADLYIDNEIAMEKGMAEYYNALREIERKNNRILRAVKSVKGKTFYNHLIEYLKNCETTDYNIWEIVRVPQGKEQKVTECGRAIKKEWVQQWSVGDSGDSWSGIICVELKPGRYLKFNFSM